MPSFTNNLATVLAIWASAASAHMILSSPTPYSADSLTNSPLSSSGSNFPCQISGDASTFYSTSGISNEYTAGESVSMSFKGSAVHGGGSCQVALSTDMQPSQSTRWSVILSIEGGCPTKDGTSAGTYDVTIPEDIPAGTYSYAWTWTSKLSGTQEYYMNCAPITIKAASGSKKRSQNIRARSDALDNYPPLAVYNMADLNSCKSTLSSDPKYPFPGSNVEHDLASGDYSYAEITGSDCFASGVTYDGSGSDSGSTATTSASGSGSSGTSGGSGSSDTTSSVAAATTTADSGSSGGGVFATGSGGSTATSSAYTAGSTGSGSSGSSSGSGTTSSSGSSSSNSAGGSCTAGEYQCSSDGSSYQQCEAGGTWSVSMSMASGTECSPGTSSSLSISATSSRKRRFVNF